jgi:hypothetical protein
MIRTLATMMLLHSLAVPAAQQQATLASLMSAAEVVVVAQISSTDYSRSPADGPMTAQAKVLAAVKGRLRRDQSFTFTETAWVGPSYRSGEIRVLFLESAGPNSWRVCSNLYAKSDFFVERDALPHLNATSLRSALEKLSAPAKGTILITPDMLK